jgi:TetR/AcrR family transcriptional repressor of nem operon
MTKHPNKSGARERLLDQGVAQFMERGYHGAGLQNILQGAGAPKGSFYNYFGSKEEFGAEAINHYIQPFIEMLDGWLRRPGLNARAALEGYFGALIAQMESRDFKGGCLLGNLIGEIGDTSETCRVALRRAVHRYRDKLSEGIERGQREGLFRTDMPAAEMADWLADVWQGALLRMKIERSSRPLRDCIDRTLKEYFKA